MQIEAFYHCPKSNYAYAEKKDTLKIRFRTAKNDVDKVWLFYGCKFNWADKKKSEMKKIASDEYFDYYETAIVESDIRIGYYFNAEAGKQSVVITEAGILEKFEDKFAHRLFFQYPSVHEVDLLHQPSWYEKAVFYQIFVERFANGKPDISPTNTVEWNSIPKPNSFYGGDLYGIYDHLDYLEELGITALYLTPIFKSISNHKYDIINYMEIDEHFGNKEIFKKLVDTAHQKGIRIILDAVFNHCGEQFAPFQDVLKHGENSDYKDWFYLNEYPVIQNPPNYETFGMIPYMPKLRTSNAKLKEYLFSVVRYWTKEFHIDGWRIDVADEPDHCFWREFRNVVKEFGEDILIIGEIWHNAQPWLLGDQFDTVMNYPVTHLAVNYFAEGTKNAKEFTFALTGRLMEYPDLINRMMFNLLDSHDTERFLYFCKEEKESLKNAAAFLMGYIGTPCVYYGTEIGLSGGYDPGCRRAFLWEKEKWDIELREYYKRLIQIRSTEKAFQSGTVNFYSTENVFVMERTYEKSSIYVIINQTDQEQSIPSIEIEDQIQELISERSMNKNSLVIPPKTAFYLKNEKSSK